MKALALVALVLFGASAACSQRVPPPAPLDSAHEACQTCKMIISDPRMASQIVAPYEEPRFFDDLNCLGTYLNGTTGLPQRAVVYVADHRTRAWVRWDQAIYTRVETLSGAMGSHVMAHASIASRDADAEAHGTPVDPHDLLPTKRLLGGS